MADPWNNLTPTVGNIVRDVVPPEFIALKQVNLDRPRFWGAGISDMLWNNLAGQAITTIPVIQAGLYKGTYVANEYVCDQTGLYKVDAWLPPGLVAVANWISGQLLVERFTGGAWAVIKQVNYLSTTTIVPIFGLIGLTSGDKLRFKYFDQFSASPSSGTKAAVAASGATVFIEFLRNPS